jgi:hypothetical protein
MKTEQRYQRYAKSEINIDESEEKKRDLMWSSSRLQNARKRRDSDVIRD